jgi:hypothetical protein
MGPPAMSQGPSLLLFDQLHTPVGHSTSPRKEEMDLESNRVDLARTASRQGGRPGPCARPRAVDQLAARDGRQDAVGRWASPTNHFRTTERLHAGWPATRRRSTCRAGAADRPALTARARQAGVRCPRRVACVLAKGIDQLAR